MESTDWLWTGDIVNEESPLQFVQPVRSTYKPRNKLRDSCNSCALSKVKCSKEQPICARCEDREILCQYSPTRRIGKRRAWPPPKTDGVATGAPIALAQEAISPMSDFRGFNKPTFSSPTEQALFSFSMDTPMSYGVMASADPTIAPGSFEDCDSLLSIFSKPNMVMSSSSSSAVLDSVPNKSQHCIGSAIELLINLYRPPTTCTLLSPAANLSLEPIFPQSIMRPMDHVLSSNRDSLNAINLILSCPCSLDVQLVLLLTSIVSKITSSYSEIAQETATQSPLLTPTAASTPLSGLEYGLSQPIELEDYRADGTGEKKKEEQSILCQLHLLVRTVENLVSKFADIAKQEGPRQCGASENSAEQNLLVASVFSHLEKYLRCQAQMLAQDIVESLRRA